MNVAPELLEVRVHTWEWAAHDQDLQSLTIVSISS
jgi:hypothetical protein